MKLRRLPFALGCCLLLAPSGHAEPAPQAALPALDGYLAEAARSDPRYRTELRVAEADSPLPPGRMAASSAYLGRITFRPKTYAELSREERAELLRDPPWHAFLLRRALPPAPTAPREPTVLRYAISAEEMLRPEPLVLVLPPA